MSKFIVDRLVALEADVCYRERSSPAEPEFGYQAGSLAVLISAPHGAIHMRDGRSKEEEEYTAGIAQLVAERTGAHALYLRRRSMIDPSWHKDVPYKRFLRQTVTRERIRLVLDIHGAAARRDFGIALGTLSGQSCPPYRDAIIRELGRHGYRIDGHGLERLDVDAQFTGRGRRGQETVTRYVWETLGIPAVQLEVNERLRVVDRRPDASSETPFRAEPKYVEQLIEALAALVQLIE